MTTTEKQLDILTGTKYFMLAAGQLPNGGFDDEVVRELRVNLVESELDEFIRACDNHDQPEQVDALLDIIVTVQGSILSYATHRDEIPTHLPTAIRADADGRDLAFAYAEWAYAENTNDRASAIVALSSLLSIAWEILVNGVGLEIAEEAAAEVTRSNDDKVNGKHGPIVWAGEPLRSKVLKPDGWVGPQIEAILRSAGLIK